MANAILNLGPGTVFNGGLKMLTVASHRAATSNANEADPGFRKQRISEAIEPMTAAIHQRRAQGDFPVAEVDGPERSTLGSILEGYAVGGLGRQGPSRRHLFPGRGWVRGARRG